MGNQMRENFKHEAHEHVRLHQAQMNEKVQAYQRVIDANHRQSLSTKEHEIMELKRQAAEERRIQNERIAQLEQMIHMQTQQNLKLQSMVDSHFAQASPAPLVESGTATMPTRTTEETDVFFHPTPKGAPRAPPTHAPGSDWVPTAPVHFPTVNDPDLERDGIEIVYMDPRYKDRPTDVKEEPNMFGASVNPRHPEGKAKTVSGNERDAGRSPAPTFPYSPTEPGFIDLNGYDPGDEDGDGGDEPSDGDAGNGGPGGNPPNPPGGNGKKLTPRVTKARSRVATLGLRVEEMVEGEMEVTKTVIRNSDENS